MAKSFAVVNPEALVAQLRSLDDVASESTLRQAAVAGARVIFDEAKVRAPVGVREYERKGTAIYPGFLRDHMLIAFDKEQSVEGKLASYIVTWSKEAFYGRFVEHGTSKMSADPFLRPAFDARREDADRAIADVIDRKVEEANT
jgi:HK97 gp10 family phage protein